MQKITDELIEKFLSGNCTKEEVAIVLDYLKENPDERYLLNEYRKTDGETPLPQGYREEMLAFITAVTGEKEQEVIEAGSGPGRGRLRSLWKWAAAAAVVILLVKGWSYIQPDGKITGEKLAVYHTPAAAWIEKYNHGKKEMLFQLPDSSTVRLLPGGRIRFRKDLGIDSPRDIQVMGRV
ncbi:MAG TPA: hypothetical protein VHC48_16085, partial [Puia sp.]|nr:hypothetical protein [Puia sp.]